MEGLGNTKPRILFVTTEHLTGRSSGSRLRALHIARALREIGEVRLFIVGGFGNEDPNCYNRDCEFQVEHYAELRSAEPMDIFCRLRDLFAHRRANLGGLIIDQKGKEKLEKCLEEFDLIWVHQLRTAYFCDRWCWPRSVMDVDDIPSTYERSVMRSGDGIGVRIRAAWRMLRWRARERYLNERFHMMSVCSERDKDYLGFSERLHVIPNGFSAPRLKPTRHPAKRTRIGFIGLLHYRPNADGIKWFINECLPGIRAKVPNVSFRVLGEGSEVSAGEGVEGLGWVSDPGEEIATWALMVVPIHSGSGTRVKIAEGFSRLCPLVATKLGAFGYEVEHRRELFLADTAAEFVDACVEALENQTSAAEMAERAWERFLTEWTWDVVGVRVRKVAEECLRNSRKICET